MLKLLLNSVFIQVVPEGGWFDLPGGVSVSPAHAGWSNADGYSLEPLTEEPPEPPAPPTMNDYRMAIDANVEAVAREWGYNGAAHIAGYVSSTVPQWAAEAVAFIAWRDQVWLAAIAALAEIEAGTQPAPESIPAFLATLPAAVRPE
ncbi:hypothetical protein [Fuscibacter oryzae]|uniref:Uncharacterized protein n=1 Tax=Fuscibacter oryzae TaxID=2803939 RepID=A0A8J7MRT0_9RHOB|nr:hypothetical protein [Fuscibacter oryzae]MBL4929322.1 hypothetical protein [Fuscibacter oryzae]